MKGENKESALEFYNVTEYYDGFNVGFILNDNRFFLTTDYKVLRGQLESGLIKCEKVLFNGKIKLIYLTNGYSTLDSLLLCMDEKIFVTLLIDILRVFNDIKDNGFLEGQRLLLMPEYIFVDTNTMKVRLIYLPVESKMQHSVSLEHQIRPTLIQLIHSKVQLNPITLQRLTMMFAEESMSLQEIHNELVKQWNQPGMFQIKIKDQSKNEKVLNMISMHKDFPLKFHIDKRDFAIGRDTSRVDGVIVGSPVVGRLHCRILYRDNKYYIEDCSSRNGTFINSEKLVSGKPKEITENSFIRIANIGFKVVFD